MYSSKSIKLNGNIFILKPEIIAFIKLLFIGSCNTKLNNTFLNNEIVVNARLSSVKQIDNKKHSHLHLNNLLSEH